MEPRGIPRRWNVPRVGVEQMVAGPVAGDDAQSRRRDVRDPRVGHRPFPARPRRIHPRELPAHTAVRIERHELVPLGRDDVEPVRRPLGVGIRAELPQEAVGATSQTPPLSADTTSSRPAAGSEKSAGSACSMPDRFAHGFEDGPAWRRERGNDHRGDG